MKNQDHLLELFLQHLSTHTRDLSAKQPRELYAPEEYMLSLGGKRLRPLLALIACDACGGDPKRALDSALCVELFHNFSLIHDDILDAAPIRRGQPSVHKKWNTNIAILSGDVMLVKAFQVLQSFPPDEREKLTQLFCHTAVEVCEGQQLDMNFEKETNVSVPNYLHMITLKTAVLLGCSLKMGAINAGASESDQNLLYDFGVHLGVAFQLMDDYLDAFAVNTEKFGKQTGGDIIANKKTFLLLKAMELADPLQKDEIQELCRIKNSEEKVMRMQNFFSALDIPKFCRQEADIHTQAAIAALDALSINSHKKVELKAFALDLLIRQT